ncbi:AraC family transcriptional regulator [Vibrio sp. ZSDE26]|uniref:AraC family transcriptional regulator n=1 Tax=Vibrio amylolyticus TaxID=2847292 RepID=A0A9X1XGV5_9VIBR|nr:AraC family transcriptional regulator [Vibrio amylolyticus]MCK6261750.1 AraC family transcriptional regulator [Vibrio amylolyticus]
MSPNVWIRAGIVIIYGSSIDANAHKHHAIQVVWPKEGDCCEFNGESLSSPLIIDSNVEHQLQLDEGWILLVEPSSVLGVTLSERLNGLPFHILDTLEAYSDLAQFSVSDEVNELLSPLFKALILPTQSLLFNESQVSDERIKKLIVELHECLDGDCIKPTHWRASEVAESLALSEGRFLHLFTQEIGVPWRPYLLWCRMICAVNSILKGESATHAAYQAGFSDSAHLSRTFKNTFGITIRQANSIFQLKKRG